MFHRSRKHLAFHVYVLRSLIAYQKLTIYQQREMVARYSPNDLDPNIDASIDSINSILLLRVICTHAITLVWCIWIIVMSEEMKKDWKSWLEILNQRNYLEKLSIPDEVRGDIRECTLESNIMRLLSFDWETIMQLMRRYIIQNPSAAVLLMTYLFGHK